MPIPSGNRHISQTVGPRCRAAIIPGGAATPPYHCPDCLYRVYAYDLVVTNHQGQTRRTRDAFSFLPTLGESDLFLFRKGDERRIYEKLGAQLRVIK
jgi:hypothetical protein